MGRILYHFHDWVGTSRGNCTATAHDGDCSMGPLTPGNEVACNQRGKTPVGRPCRCEHEVPEPWFKTKAAGKVQLWEGAAKKKPAVKAKSQKRPAKRSSRKP